MQTKTCCQCSASFSITDKDLEFYKKVSPKFGGEIFEIPSPTFCPECRSQRRWSFRNEQNFYRNICSVSGKSVISVYSPDKSFKVVDQNIWWSDRFDAKKYFLDYNESEDFFSQFEKLGLKVPRISLYGQGNENCDYTFDNNFSKDNYMTAACDNTEKMMYSSYCFLGPKNAIDCFWLDGNCNYVYDSMFIYNSSNIKYSRECHDSRNLDYCFDCTNCEYCIACKNLINKKYCIENKQYLEDEFKQEAKKYTQFSKQDYRERFYNFIIAQPTKPGYNKGSQECIGDHITNGKNCINCYGGEDSKDCKNLNYFAQVNDCYDANDVAYSSSLIYEGQTIIKNNSKVLFCSFMMEGNYDCLYSMELKGGKNCFGCIGLQHKQYCILNKQYTKEEYNILVPKIIKKMKADGEWGEFFPSSISPFGYNETVAQEYFPINSPLQRGARGGDFNRSDYEAPLPQAEKLIPASKLPNNITDIPDDILNRAIECEITKKPFKIIPQELEFYRKHNLPIPKKHPDQRHLERIKLRNPRKLFEKDCDKCGIKMQTTYAPERLEKVYCEECYNKEID